MDDCEWRRAQIIAYPGDAARVYRDIRGVSQPGASTQSGVVVMAPIAGARGALCAGGDYGD